MHKSCIMGNTIINCQQGDSSLPKQSLLCLPTLYVAKHQNILAVKILSVMVCGQERGQAVLKVIYTLALPHLMKWK